MSSCDMDIDHGDMSLLVHVNIGCKQKQAETRHINTWPSEPYSIALILTCPLNL